ncbi:hypothetical protein BO94DRAFT_560255 [Aspergillus sclerotioniger CBS 115572]|uniref:Protein kinase domain-containing protein n=1 Tax=Aspergillus sclerotioniger CBS 115572 TaxID=1450535 RepID=A0A317VBS3_9EURO|nr:hypothetical protein BO94DRAFT_560255 [Aspergillus sclerotioniger CBS 115572]PWY71804.1 hypothetical protein BO94DRAFT_560255 [Aspergillus sclerotioniger CBS 115572]
MHANTSLRVDSDVLEFCTSLQHSEASSIYEVMLNNDRYCLKVYHDNGDPGYAQDGRDLNRLRCELNAYRNLQAGGVYVDQLDPALYQPHLDRFANDINKPGAILLEFLPKTESLNCVNYSNDCFKVAMQGLKEVHQAKVLHNDPYPKNILIVHGDPERIVWVDFDVSMSYSDSQLQDSRVRIWFEDEIEWAASFGNILRKDQERGEPPNLEYY